MTAMVLLEVDGGIADATVVSGGSIQIVTIDWDVVEEGSYLDVEDALSEALTLPDSFPRKEKIIETIRLALSRFGDDTDEDWPGKGASGWQTRMNIIAILDTHQEV
jgi:hypothetical protein